MKKSVIILSVVLLAAVFASSCAQHNTCPAYRGSVAMATAE